MKDFGPREPPRLIVAYFHRPHPSKYNRRVRVGRGFSLVELKVRYSILKRSPETSAPKPETRVVVKKGNLLTNTRIGCWYPQAPCSHHRHCRRPPPPEPLEESLAANVQRLKEYKARLILFPRKSNKPKKGDTPEDQQNVETTQTIDITLPTASSFSEIKKSDIPAAPKGGAYRTLREARSRRGTLVPGRSVRRTRPMPSRPRNKRWCLRDGHDGQISGVRLAGLVWSLCFFLVNRTRMWFPTGPCLLFRA